MANFDDFIKNIDPELQREEALRFAEDKLKEELAKHPPGAISMDGPLSSVATLAANLIADGLPHTLKGIEEMQKSTPFEFLTGTPIQIAALLVAGHALMEMMKKEAGQGPCVSTLMLIATCQQNKVHEQVMKILEAAWKSQDQNNSAGVTTFNNGGVGVFFNKEPKE